MMFELAYDLGMTVESLKNTMPADEFIGWIAYLGIRADEANESQTKSEFHKPGRYKK